MLPKGKEIAAAASCSNSAADSTGIFPQEVISDILSRLPVKTLLCFKCVSKQWRKLVSQPGFISEHLTRSPASLLIHAHKSPNPAHERSFDDILNAAKKAKAALEEARLKYGEEAQSQPEEEEETKLQPDGHAIYTWRVLNPHFTIDRILDFPGSKEAGFKNLEIVGVQNGVVCVAMEPFLKKLVLWNPATRSTRSLPDPSIKLSKKLYCSSSAGFGFDPAQNAYKVIRIIRHRNMMTPDVAEFLNTRVGIWKRVGQYPGRLTRFWVKRPACDAVVRGVPYWRATAAFKIYNLEGVPDTEERGTLLWFDVRDDVFDLEQCTWVDEKSREMCFGEIRDCLGVALWEKGSTDHGGIEVWVKEGGGWSLKYRVGSFKWNGPPPVNVVGFYGERGMVQEVGSEGNLILFDLTEKTGNQDDSVNGQDSSRKDKGDSVNGQDSSRKEKGDSVNGQDSSRKTKEKKRKDSMSLINGQDSSRKEKDDSVNGQDSSRKEKGDSVNGQDSSRKTKEKKKKDSMSLISGQDSSRKEKDDSVNGQDSSRKEKEKKKKDLMSLINGQDSSRKEKDDSVNGQDSSRKTKEKKKKDLVSLINVQDSLPNTLKTMGYRESLTDV